MRHWAFFYGGTVASHSWEMCFFTYLAESSHGLGTVGSLPKIKNKASTNKGEINA
jgi:hypothetical protein